MSSDTGDGRVVSATITGSLSTGASPTVNLTWSSATIINDTHSAFNSTTGYTAPISGFYQFNGHFNTDSANGSVWDAWVSGSNRQTSGRSISGFVTVSGVVFLLAGQNLTFRPNVTGGNVGAVSSGNYFTISRVSAGSQIIASSETVACEAVMTSSNNPGTDQPIRFNFVVRDTHGSYNTTTFRYTIPMSGWYQINFMFNISTGGHSGDWIYLFINEVRNRTFCLISISPNTEYFPSNVTAYFLAGDIIDIRSGASTAPNFYGDTTNNTRTRMTVHRIGI